MDGPCTAAELAACLRDIARVNRLTFAQRPTLAWLASLPRADHPLRIVDVGCGYGDGLRRVHRWATREGVAVELLGVDLNADAITAARSVTPAGMGIRWVQGDAYTAVRPGSVDVVLSSLLTHHLEDAEIVRFLQWMEATARVGWFVNDLHRTPVPYRTFAMLMKVLPFHHFVKHDGLVSIRRSFVAEDWRGLCAAAGLPLKEIAVRAYRPARLCVERVKAQGTKG